MSSRFAGKIKQQGATVSQQPVEDVQEGGVATAPPPKAPSRQRGYKAPAREGLKPVGGHYDPAVSKQLKIIAAEEDTTINELVGEALNLLFQTRRLPMIAKSASTKSA